MRALESSEMSQYLRWMETNFELVLPFFIVWSVAWVAFFAWRRRRSGCIHPPFTQAEVRFTEKYVSGSSDKNLITRMGVAINALVVTVLKDAVLIEPIGIFKWLVPPGFGDLEHYLAKSDILRVESASTLGRNTVRLEVRGRDGAIRTLQLALRKRDEFLAALKA